MKRVFLVLLALNACVSALAQKEIVSITEWRVHAGDNPAWSNPAFDDSTWARSSFPVLEPLFIETSGLRWFRATFPVPSDFHGQDLAIGLPAIDDVYDLYIEGVKVGTFGSWEPTPHAILPRHAVFRLPPGQLAGSIGHIALRRFNGKSSIRLLPFSSAGNFRLLNAPEIGSALAIEAREKSDRFEGVIQLLSWNLTDVFFLFAGAISFVLFSTRTRRKEYLYLGIFCVGSGLPQLLGVLFATSTTISSRSLGPTVTYFAYTLARPLSLLFLSALWPRYRRILLFGVAIGVLFGFIAAYSQLASSDAWVVYQYGSNYILPLFELLAVWGLLLDQDKGSLAIASCVLLNRATFAWYLTATRNHWPDGVFTVGRFLVDTRSVTSVIFIFVTLVVLYLRYRDEQTRQAAIDQDLAAARRMQAQLLAGSALNPPGFAVDAVYRPAREVGGDFYRTVSLEDCSLLVVVGDVSGKGLDAAMLVAVILGSLANETHRSPASLLEYMNRAVVGRTGGDFITACCAHFFPDGRVVIANAGHIAPCLDAREITLDNGLPLGISTQSAYSETEIKTSGVITFMSDGVVEARNANGELLGFERMAALTAKPAAEIADAAHQWGQEDDITVLTIARVTVP